MTYRHFPILAVLALGWMPFGQAAEDKFDVDHVFPAAEVDATPEILKTTHPIYPGALIGTGTIGMAAVAVTVDQMGDIEEIRVVKSSAPEFAKPAEDCVRYWRFLPGNHKGRNVKVRIVVPIRFSEKNVAESSAMER